MDEKNIYVASIIKKLLTKKRFIFLSCILGAVVGLVVGFSLPKEYEAKVLFAPETEQSVGAGVSSIASMMGVNLDNSVDAISVEMFPDVVASTPFLFELFPLQIQTIDSLSTTLVDYMKNYQKKPWWSHVFEAPFKFLAWVLNKDEMEDIQEYELRNLPREERVIIGNLAENIKVNYDKKTGKTYLSVRMQDPIVAATVLDTVVENLKDYMSDYRTSKSRMDVENLEIICDQRKQDYYDAQTAYANFVDGNKNLVLLKAQAEQLKLQQEMQLAYQVYSQVATQLEGARIKEQQAKPVFVILEPVSVPDRKAAPSRLKLLVVFVFLAALCAASWVLIFEEYWSQLKK